MTYLKRQAEFWKLIFEIEAKRKNIKITHVHPDDPIPEKGLQGYNHIVIIDEFDEDAYHVYRQKLRNN